MTYTPDTPGRDLSVSIVTITANDAILPCMDTTDLLRKAHFMIARCRAEGVEPFGWGMPPDMWLSIEADAPIYLFTSTTGRAENRLYGLPVEVSDVYTDLSICII